MRRAWSWTPVLALSCSACAGPHEPTQSPEDVSDSTAAVVQPEDLSIAGRWAGPVAVDDGPGSEALELVVVRDAAGYEELLARLPEKRVQKRGSPPPNDDPLLERPPIDFAQHMLVVLIRNDTLEPAEVLRVQENAQGLVVTYFTRPSPPAARPVGMGAYAAILVPRTSDPQSAVSLVEPRMIRNSAAVAGAVGSLVTLRGELSQTKIPTLLGVDVDPGIVSAGERAEATGWLRSTVVTQEDIDAVAPGEFATRGPGTFYYLLDPTADSLAKAQPIY